MKISIFW